MPPVWMWPLDHELDTWFEEVKRKRKERTGPNDDDEEAPMMQNELARARRK